MDAKDLLKTCLEKKVAFVPGESFHPAGGGKNTMRINFSNATHEEIEMGIKIDFEDGPIGLDRFSNETRVALHATGQEAEIGASYLPEPDCQDEHPHRAEFISATVTVRVPNTDRREPASDRKVSQLFLSVKQACELREALHEAIVEACRKDDIKAEA